MKASSDCVERLGRLQCKYSWTKVTHQPKDITQGSLSAGLAIVDLQAELYFNSSRFQVKVTFHLVLGLHTAVVTSVF